jgi:sulfoxide reductase heme-binding subunit YedZ
VAAQLSAQREVGGTWAYRARRVGGAAAGLTWTSLALALPLGAGYLLGRVVEPTLATKDFPWVTGRALGIAAFISLTALVAIGLWARHPWRFRARFGHAETRLRAHSVLAAATVALVLGHLASLAADRYAGVGWVGALVPGLSHYRTTAVGLGTGAFALMLVVGATARFAGRWGTGHWLLVHRLASVCFALTWAHGVLAGTDTAALRPVYIASAVVVALLLVTRAFAGNATTAPAERDGPVLAEGNGAPGRQRLGARR